MSPLCQPLLWYDKVSRITVFAYTLSSLYPSLLFREPATPQPVCMTPPTPRSRPHNRKSSSPWVSLPVSFNVFPSPLFLTVMCDYLLALNKAALSFSSFLRSWEIRLLPQAHHPKGLRVREQGERPPAAPLYETWKDRGRTSLSVSNYGHRLY